MSNNKGGIFAKCPKIRDFQLKKDKKTRIFFACGGLISDVEQQGGDFCEGGGGLREFPLIGGG